jgi:hypothetical protein
MNEVNAQRAASPRPRRGADWSRLCVRRSPRWLDVHHGASTLPVGLVVKTY